METRPFDPAAYLDSKEAIAAYLADARASGTEDLADAVEVVTRARALMARSSEARNAVARRRQDRPVTGDDASKG